MRFRGSSIAVCLAICSLYTSASASTLIDVWRTPFGVPRSVSVNRTDGSCWAVTGSSVMHFAADGTVLSQSNGFWYPQSVSVDPGDGSCWVADKNNEQLVHLNADGAEVLRLDGFDLFWSVSVDPTDGSCWTAGRHITRVAANGIVMHRQSAYRGRWASVDPTDGSCWVSHFRHPSPGAQLHLCVSRFEAEGKRLWTNFDVGSAGYHLDMWGRPYALSINEFDNTGWMANPDSTGWMGDPDDPIVLHLDADGSEIARYSFGGAMPFLVAADPSDGSCWVGFTRDLLPDYPGSALLHISEDGTPLGIAPSGERPVLALSLDPGDGSFWAGISGGWDPARLQPWGGDVAHFAGDGTELWRRGTANSRLYRVEVDPNDGSCWVTAHDRVLHLDAHGREVLMVDGLTYVRELAVNPTDGSCWAAGGSKVYHIAADGTVLWSESGMDGIGGIAVNPIDGSCRVAGYISYPGYSVGVVTALSENGTVLWQVEGFEFPGSISVNPGDGSCWVADGLGNSVVHLGADGVELWRTTQVSVPTDVAVDPNDGSCWVADSRHHRVLHFAANGALLSSSLGFDRPRWLTVDPTDGSCWVSEQIGDSKNNRGNLVHLAANGEEILRAGGIGCYSPIAVSGATGCIWVVDGGSGQLARFRPWFDDVPRTHWAFAAILACVEAGIVTGYPGGTYQPSAAITRDQMAVYIARALASGESNVPDFAGTPTFPDMPAGYWALNHVEYAVDQNVVTGYDDGTYHPEYQVTRDQMAVYVARAMVAPTGEAALADYVPAAPRNFPDVPSTGYGDDGTEPFWAWKHIEYCAEQGVVGGYGDGYYRPEWVVTRDQMAVYVARAFDLLD